MGLLEQCREFYNSSDLYEVLGINENATNAEVRKAYYRASLKVHPDRAPKDPLAKEKFQVLGKVYAVLSDKGQRAVYDEQGIIDEDSDIFSQDRCWIDHWRLLFPRVTMQDIVDFEKKYKGSEEERLDVIRLYKQHQGDMDKIMPSVLCSTDDDEPRVVDIIQAAIKSGEVKAFTAFTKESEGKKRARKKRADREREEAEEMRKDLGLGSDDNSLVLMLKRKQKTREQNFDPFFSDLEAKYAKKSPKTQKAKK